VEDDFPDGQYTRRLIYPLDLNGHRTEIFDDRPSQNWVGADQWWARVAGQRLLMGGSTSYLRHADAVGSSTMLTDQTGAVDGDATFYPWGQVWQISGGSDGTFGDLGFQVNYPLPPSATRDYNPTLGRWLTPDPMGGDITNPQSLNRYTGVYPERSRRVTNNPATLNDPLGLFSDNPGDPCSDPTYAESNAECQGVQCDPTYDPSCWCAEYGDCGYSGGYGYYGGGGGGPITPPAGQPPLGEGWRPQPIPCVNLSTLAMALTAQLATALGVPPGSLKLTPVGSEGGGADFSVNGGGQVNPTNIPYANEDVPQNLHHGEHSQFWYPAPKRSVPGLGRNVHVLFNEGAVNPVTGLPTISNVQVHVDIGNPLTKSGGVNPFGAGWHLLTDMSTIAILSKIEGCSVKFQ